MSGAEAGADAGGCCAIVLYSALSALGPWCDTKAFGSGGSNGQARCCGSCCNKSFNEDSTDKWDLKKEGQEEKTQPAPTQPMSISAAAEETKEGAS
ncbi:hypothetical protein C8F01DRAFT_463358 [Mycena amicta]|nr:hypothetical protein C8F01DRAFT_463358 [Mycena amicta]